MFRKLLVFSLCFLMGFLFQLPFGADNLAGREAVVPSGVLEKSTEIRTCDEAHESKELKKLKRRYDLLVKRRHKLVKENLKLPLITETERYWNLEGELHELRKKYRKQLPKEYRALVHRQTCSEN